jgi:hypothetical protein
MSVEIDAFREVINTAKNLLLQLKSELINVEQSLYILKCESVMDGTIGQHVRHVLDHFKKLSPSKNTSVDISQPVRYDQRQRNVPEEADKEEAFKVIDKIIQGLETLLNSKVKQPLKVQVMLSGCGKEIMLDSSLSREVWFACHHAIHHFAMIRMIMVQLKIQVTDANFGYAPSTLNNKIDS